MFTLVKRTWKVPVKLFSLVLSKTDELLRLYVSPLGYQATEAWKKHTSHNATASAFSSTHHYLVPGPPIPQTEKVC